MIMKVDHEGNTYTNTNTNTNNNTRATLTLCWGFLSILIGFTFLKTSFKYTIERSLFVAVTSVTTIGYGPVIDANNEEDHFFLTGYFLVCIFPFIGLQMINIYDAMQSNAELIHMRINEKLENNSNTNSSNDSIRLFRNEILWTLFGSILIILMLLLIGTVTYR